jgi:hypothetical protein
MYQKFLLVSEAKVEESFIKNAVPWFFTILNASIPIINAWVSQHKENANCYEDQYPFNQKMNTKRKFKKSKKRNSNRYKSSDDEEEENEQEIFNNAFEKLTNDMVNYAEGNGKHASH